MLYQHEEYPKMLHKPDGTYTIVKNDKEKAGALDDGWNLKPGPRPEVHTTAEVESEKPRRGRPPKK